MEPAALIFNDKGLDQNRVERRYEVLTAKNPKTRQRHSLALRLLIRAAKLGLIRKGIVKVSKLSDPQFWLVLVYVVAVLLFAGTMQVRNERMADKAPVAGPSNATGLMEAGYKN